MKKRLRIAFLKQDVSKDAPRDTQGHLNINFRRLGYGMATMKWLSGSEDDGAPQTTSQQTVEFETLARCDLGIDTSWMVEACIGGQMRYYNITAINETPGPNRLVKIVGVEDTSAREVDPYVEPEPEPEE